MDWWLLGRGNALQQALELRTEPNFSFASKGFEFRNPPSALLLTFRGLGPGFMVSQVKAKRLMEGTEIAHTTDFQSVIKNPWVSGKN